MVIVQTRAAWDHFQARFAEWLVAGIVLGWGLYVLMHPGMMTSPGVASLWTGLLNLAAEQTWGVAAMMIGTIRLFALYINGAHKRTPMIRLGTAFGSIFLLTQIVLCMYDGGAPNTGLVVYTGLIGADFYSAFRASADMVYVTKREDSHSAESQRVVPLRRS